MTIQNQIRLEQIVRSCNAFCLRRQAYIDISQYHSQRCFEVRPEDEIPEEATKAPGYIPSAEDKRTLLGYCKYFETRLEKKE